MTAKLTDSGVTARTNAYGPARPQPVIAVGSLGGSGTRMVAQLLESLGVFMGAYLNASHDNLLFTALFKNPAWLAGASEQEVLDRFGLFEKLSKGYALSGAELKNLIRICWQSEHASVRLGLRALLANRFGAAGSETIWWGWKEPNTQLFIDYLPQAFPAIKYIQVIRHGLDMAFSGNQQQLLNWGHRFGIDSRDTAKARPGQQLDYWIRSNQFVLEKGRQLFGDHLYVLNYDRLCSHPESELRALLTFLGAAPEPEHRQKMMNLIQISGTTGRYRQHDLRLFSPDQLASVEALGFPIESRSV